MRFLIHSHGWSADPVEAWLPQTMTTSLAAHGHSVDVIVTSATGQVSAGPQDPQIPGVRVYRSAAREWLPPQAARAQALLTPHFDRHFRRWLGEYDALLIHTPAILTGGIASRLKRAGVVDRVGMFMWDFFPQAHVDTGEGIWLRAQRPLRNIEFRLVDSVDVAFPMSPRGVEFCRYYYERPDFPCVVVPPWGTDWAPPNVGEPNSARFTVVWGGQFSARRAIGDILSAAKSLLNSDPAIVIRLAGEGPHRAFWQSQAAKMGLNNVVFEGALDKVRYHQLLGSADLGLSVIEPGTTPSFPSKTVDYTTRGLPMVVTVEQANDFGEIVEGAGFGLAGPAGDTRQLAQMISRLARDKAVTPRAQMSRNSRHFFKEELEASVAAQRVSDYFGRVR